MSAGPPPPAAAKHLERVMDATAREFYRRLHEDGELATTRCAACERATFPPRPRCPRCGGETTWMPLPRTGTLEAFTTQETALRFAAPAVLALARMDDVVVPGIAESGYEELRIGDEVAVELREQPELGMTLVHYRSTGRSP